MNHVPARNRSRIRKSMLELTNSKPNQSLRVDRLIRTSNGQISRTTMRLTRKEFIDSRKLRLAKTQPPLSTTEVKELRKSLGLSQALFAKWLDVSVQTIHNWEQKTGVERGPALRLLHIIHQEQQKWAKKIRMEFTPR